MGQKNIVYCVQESQNVQFGSSASRDNDYIFKDWTCKMKQSVLFLLLLFFCTSLTGKSKPKFEFYKVDLNLDSLATLHVKETLVIVSNGQDIKHGIYRHYKNERIDAFDKVQTLTYSLISVKQNGEPAKFHVRQTKDLFMLYVGDRSIILPPGRYEYELEYTIKGVIDYFENKNELNWEIVGLQDNLEGSEFQTLLQLPDETYITSIDCSTKNEDNITEDCSYVMDPHILFTTKTGQNIPNFKMHISFNKGSIWEPPALVWYKKHKLVFCFLMIMFGVLLNYITTKFKTGKIVQEQKVVPIYELPEHVSPATSGILDIKKVHHKFIISSIIQLAVKGYIKIMVNSTDNNKYKGSGSFTLLKTDKKVGKLAHEEKVILNTIFKEQNELIIDGSYHPSVAETLRLYRYELNNDFPNIEEKGFERFSFYLPIVTSTIIIVTIINALHLDFPNYVNDIMLGLSIFIFPFLGYLLPILPFFFRAIKYGAIITCILFFIAVLTIQYLSPLLEMNIYNLIGYLIFAIFAVILSRIFLLRPLKSSLSLKTRVNGFKLFLETSQNNEVVKLDPSDVNKHLYNKYLPYALALNRQDAWTEKYYKYLKRNEMDTTTVLDWLHSNQALKPKDIKNICQGLMNSFFISSVQDKNHRIES